MGEANGSTGKGRAVRCRCDEGCSHFDGFLRIQILSPITAQFKRLPDHEVSVRTKLKAKRQQGRLHIEHTAYHARFHIEGTLFKKSKALKMT
ncbi:hypothetical protein G7K_5920-t1 [Saitoella complicata NRRL Y-17804]|uniref:Uncharacterized protein n=1 Tax=Saitoella complicata (strain BCRC 22490 / CBS 7301 / JCM 7358 / NBRC 10748 / NRRL Y-17804) TaxID=698492 RepID=A0A0E9NPQ9_SAICN|nr:hypothetical protein G7K_5920-t1 [Saitoella complicata NRRL Y-17804]